ncbi:C40 family peptidase [Streptomyces sp. AK08-02]|uniref:C40 family peptidase n=1 Tax=Streptomyces sp. AK08-02 TaxID=3028654 RepID=UPI0029A570D3|nr:NlpC/P60 family protein [Streptomyces sp. AK08-02]MDX3751850.1 NlpC/P60 family protein [Streptomyces sp. AK08-02]
MAPERTRDDGPSREEVQQRINSLYDQAESFTGTFNATRAMKLGIRRRVTPAPEAARRRSDPALDEISRPWFDVGRAQLGPTVPAVLPPDRRPARTTEARPARPADLLPELTARPVPEPSAGPAAALEPAVVAQLPAAPVAALSAVPAPRQEAPSPNALSAEPSWFPSPSQGAAPLPATGGLPAEALWRLPDSVEQARPQPAEEWQLPQPAGLGPDAFLDAATPLYAGTLRDGDYALVTELPLVTEPFPVAADPFPAPVPQEPYGTQAPYITQTPPHGTQTSYATEYGTQTPPHGTQTSYATGTYYFAAESGAKAAKAVAFARAQIGRPCVWGAAGPGSYDNAGLVQAAWKAAGVALPRAVHDQASAGMMINLADVRPGDLVFFHGEAGHVGHVGISVGDGMMMHAPNPGSRVREDSIFAAGEAAIHSVLRPA